MNEFDFDLESLGQVQPQLRRQEAPRLNISAQQAEFDRQQQGAQRVQDQVVRNQQRMIDNVKTEAQNSGYRYQDLKKLASFSQTLTKELVGYQQFKNEQKVQTGMMKAYTQGYTPQEMAEVRKQESELNAAQTEANRVAQEYEQSGGQPDVAQELRNMTGWEAYGYAKGMLQQAGGSFGSWLAKRANMPVMKLNGTDLSLTTANTSVERDMVLAAHRDTYMSQFTGMNPKLLNEYLFPNMKKAEAAAVQQWDADYKSRIDKENKGQALDQLKSNLTAGMTPQQFLTDLDRNQYVFGGMYATREEYANMLRGLIDIDDPSVTPTKLKELLGVAIGKNGNKIKLSSWKEFDGLVQYAEDKERERSRQRYNDAIQQDKEANLLVKQIIESEKAAGNLEGKNLMQKYQLIDMIKRDVLKRPGMKNTASMDALLASGNEDEERAEEIILDLQASGQGIPEELLVTKALKAKYGAAAQNTKWAKDQLQTMEPTIEANLLEALQLTEGKVQAANNDYFTEGLLIAKDYALKRLLTIKAANPMLEDKDAYAQVRDEIKAAAGKPGEFKSSIFNFENQRAATPKEERLNTFRNASEWLQGEIGAGNTNVYQKEFIPGTGREYEAMVKSIEAGEPEIPQIYHDLAARLPNYTGIDIARAQLKVRGGPELIPTKFEETIDGLSPATQAIIRNKGAYLTPQRVDRAIVTQQASNVNNPAVQELLDYVVQDESGGNYNIIYGGRTVEGLENMTIGQVIQEQHYNVNRTGGGAVGKYQMIRPEEAARAVGLNLNSKFSKENQDKMAMYYMELAGYSRFMKGQISAQSFARGLASQWAALHTAEGGSYYNDGVNKAGGSTTYQGLLEKIKALVAKSPYNAPENISPSLR